MAVELLTSLENLRFLKLDHTPSLPWIRALSQKCCPLTLRKSPIGYEALIRFVMGRRKAGVPIHRALVAEDVGDCFRTPEGRGRLEEHVGFVEWYHD